MIERIKKGKAEKCVPRRRKWGQKSKLDYKGFLTVLGATKKR